MSALAGFLDFLVKSELYEIDNHNRPAGGAWFIVLCSVCSRPSKAPVSLLSRVLSSPALLWPLQALVIS